MEHQAAFSGSRNHQEASARAARSRSSVVRIHSIYIDINAPEQSNSQKCEHFTIRGLVSKFREKNGKVCLPFSLDGDGSSDDLPPLQVPSYKWWQCQHCLSKIDAAGISEDVEKISVSQCSQSKTKCSHSHKSLENIVAYLSTKLNRHTLQDCLSQQEAKFTSKIIPETQTYDPVLDLNGRRRAVNKSRSAENRIVANRQTVADEDKHKKRLLTPSRMISEFSAPNGVKQKDKDAVDTEQMHRHGDELGGLSRRRTRRIRLLTEIDEDGNTAQHIETQRMLTNEFQNPQPLLHINGSCSQERNDHFQEQDGYPQIQNADTVVGRCEMRQGRDLHTAFVNSEIYTTPGNTFDGAISLQAKKVQFWSKQIPDTRIENHQENGFLPGSSALEPVQNRGNKTNIDLFKLSEPIDLSLHQSFCGRATNSFHDSLPSPQVEGQSFLSKTVNTNHQVAFAFIYAGKDKDIAQISHQTQSLQDEFSSKVLRHFPDRYYDTRSIVDLDHTENGTPRNAIDTQYDRESSRPFNSYGEKNIWQGINGTSSQKRPSHGPGTANKKLKRSSITEGGPLVLQKSESLGRSSNDKMVGVQEHPEFTLRKFRANMMQEVATSDDIPMEIVELMAKNQYERRLQELTDGNFLLQSGSKLKNTVMDATGVVHDGAPCVLNGLATGKQNSSVVNRTPSGHPMQRHSAEGTRGSNLSCQPEQASVLRYSTMASSRNVILQDGRYGIHNLGRELEVSPKAHALLNTWQPAYQQSDKTGRVWPMIPPNDPVHMPSALQGNTYLSKMSRYSSYDSRGHNVKKLSLNAAGIGNESNNTRSEVPHASCPIRVDTPSQLMQSPKSYGSEAIPAMHLLSLMDAGVQSSTPSDAINNKKTFDRPFSNDHLAKELAEFSLAVGKASPKSKKPSANGNYNKSHVTDASCQCSPAVPLGSVVSSLHTDVGNKKVPNPSSQYQERSHMKRDTAASTILNKNEARKYYNARLAISGAGTVHQPVPVHGSLNRIHGLSYSLPGSSRSHMHGNFCNHPTLLAGDSYGTIRRSPDDGLCCLNRNPADFTIPGPGNEYMIGPEDLKFRTRAGPSSFGRQVHPNMLEQQRIGNNTTSKRPTTNRHPSVLQLNKNSSTRF